VRAYGGRYDIAFFPDTRGAGHYDDDLSFIGYVLFLSRVGIVVFFHLPYRLHYRLHYCRRRCRSQRDPEDQHSTHPALARPALQARRELRQQ